VLLTGCGAVGDVVASIDPPTDVELLEAVSLGEQDASEAAVFQAYEGGDETVGRTSLDLCYGDFPSEATRTGRNQVGIGDLAGTTWVSSEAILYPDPAQASEAMDELAAARQACPEEPVPPADGSGEPVTWTFQDPPDATWPEQQGITRQAYAFTTTDAEGEQSVGTATYLQRGRMILALYVTPPDGPQVAIRNAPDAARFHEVMTNRLASLDADALQRSNGPGTREDPDDVEA
jgi:hypothetical protein